MSMPFLGKWSFAPNAQVVQINARTGVLSVGAAPSDSTANFNAYGTPTSFILQAMNGQYVTFNGTSYTATESRSGNTTCFSLESVGGNTFRVVDLGINGAGTNQFYWNDLNGTLGQVAKTSSPPATTSFAQTIVTIGLQDFPKFATLNPDLSWVYLENANLASMAFTSANLANADLSNATLTNAVFSSATLISANLTGANAANAHFDSAIMNGANLTNAVLTQATMNQAQLAGAILNGASMSGVMLNNATVTNAKLLNVALTGFGTLVDGTDFTGSDLTGADFTGATSVNSGTGNVPTDFSSANLTGVTLSNASAAQTTVFMQNLKINAQTNFTAAQIRYLDFTSFDLQGILFTHADMTGCKLDQTKLNNAELGFANLTSATMTGNIPLFGANLSNATLTGVNMTGAQMGSLGLLFFVPQGSPDYTTFLNGLQQNTPTAVVQVFKDSGITLSVPPTIVPSASAPGTFWTVENLTGANTYTYSVELQTSTTVPQINVFQPTAAAVLANAFMKDAILTGANLYGVRASGVQLYGQAKLDGNANLVGAQFDNSNLANINLKQTRLNGTNFNYALLAGAQFSGADLTPNSADGQASSFIAASLQGANFSDAKLAHVVFTDAAISIAQPNSTNAAGVWLFTVPAQQAAAVLSQLNAAANPTNNFSLPVMAATALVPGPVPSSVVGAFAQHGLTLSSSAIITVIGVTPYWIVTDGGTTYVVTQSLDTKQDIPALGVAPGINPLTAPTFFMPLSLETDLINGPVDAAVRTAFQTGGNITLSSAAMINIQQQLTDWQIVDLTATYSLWLGLTGMATWQIYVRPSIPAVIQLFTNYSTPLSQRTTIASPSTGLWAVNNDSDNPFNPVTNYIKFNVLQNAIQGLDVYGSALRVVCLAAQGVSEYLNIDLDVTQLAQTDLDPTSICPNSLTVASNLADKIQFPQWMRARIPPRAPFCIPSEDGYYYCPN
jgi:uncharacterized protein YjbI with pentapeptide repeats